MIDQSKNARSIFLEIVEQAPHERWAESLDQACGDDQQLRKRVQRLLDAHEEIGSFMDRPAADPFTIDVPIAESPGTVIGPYKLLRADRRRGFWRGVPGRAGAAGAAPGGSEDHQARHGHPPGDRPLRGRAAGLGDDGSSEHCQSARCRRHRERPAVLRDGAGPGRPDYRVLRPVQSHDSRAAGTVHHRLPGGAACPPEGRHPPRHQADQRAGGHAGRPARRQKSSTSAWPRRSISGSPNTR